MSTTMRNHNLFCTNCGQSFPLRYPILIKDFTKKTKAFEELHKDCPPTWKEPEVDQSQGAKEKAIWWMANGEHGQSSLTLWNCLMGNEKYPINYPYDPDDFSRCYKLLKAVPEWKTAIHKLKKLCPEWAALIDNWDKLTEMYEENTRTNWKNYEKIGMYELMIKCISGKN